MSQLHMFAPADLRRALWSASSVASRSSLSFLPAQIIQNVIKQVTGYAVNAPAITAEPYWAAGLQAAEEKILLHAIENATNLQEYQTCAERLDHLQGHDTWKAELTSSEPEYSPEVIVEHMRQLKEAQAVSDLGAMQHLIRTSLSRDLGGMNHVGLYKHSWSGTKLLIEDYISTVLECIETFAMRAIEFKLDTKEVQFYESVLQDSLKYFGRSAITLSGGGTLGMKHIGVVKTLWEADILPGIISGSSAGSIIAGIVGATGDAEMKQVLDVFPHMDLACFDPPGTAGLGWLTQRAKTWFQNQTLFRMNHMQRALDPFVGDLTFQEAYYKTRRVLNICVSSADSGEPRLLNYITAPNVLIWSAICASCSVPGVFPSANVFEKDPATKEVRVWMQHAEQLFVDGSLEHDIPMRKLSEMFNVNFFIVSQVNPHVRLFLDPEGDFKGRSQQVADPGWLHPVSLYRGVKHATRREILHRAQQIKNIGLENPSLRWASVLSQQYTGDINILPEIRYDEYSVMLSNPSTNFMLQATRDGERATWPKIYRIKNCVAIELGLIRAMHVLRERIAVGPDACASRELHAKGDLGRAYSICGQRPRFLRQRSLTTVKHDDPPPDRATLKLLSKSVSPGPSIYLRRNLSLGTLSDRFHLPDLSMSRMPSPLQTPLTAVSSPWSPSAIGDTLRMTTTTPSFPFPASIPAINVTAA